MYFYLNSLNVKLCNKLYISMHILTPWYSFNLFIILRVLFLFICHIFWLFECYLNKIMHFNKYVLHQKMMMPHDWKYCYVYKLIIYIRLTSCTPDVRLNFKRLIIEARLKKVYLVDKIYCILAQFLFIFIIFTQYF